MATKIDPKTLFSTPNHCVTSFSLWNIRFKKRTITNLKKCHLIDFKNEARVRQS